MTVINIIFRVEEICKKYDKYDVDKQRELGASGDDAFSRLFNSIDTDIESVVHVRLSYSLSFETQGTFLLVTLFYICIVM